jgi:DNA-binding FadR family transcriptional regulator
LIADRLRYLIRAEKLCPGDRLPTEKDLAEQFGVGLMTIREAMRVLEAEALVRTRSGIGAVVSEPPEVRTGLGPADRLLRPPPTVAELIEARLVLEASVVPIIIERVTHDDICELRRLTTYSRPASHADSGAAAARFHRRVLACTHSAAIELVARSLDDILVTWLRNSSAATPRMCRHAATDHRRFVEAITKRDVELAEQIARQHLARLGHVGDHPFEGRVYGASAT